MSVQTEQARGTTIVLRLRDGEDDLLRGHRLRSIIGKYSDHISLPILMPEEETGGQAPAAETPVNTASAPWTRPRSELTESDYHDFYQHVTGDSGAPLAWLHSNRLNDLLAALAEGTDNSAAPNHKDSRCQ